MNRLFVFVALSFFAFNTKAQSYPEMIIVEGGTFNMGDEQGIGEADELPVHPVTLKTFSIAKTETTVLQWKTYCNATGRKMPDPPSWGWIDSHPMVNVNWEDAVAYCDWMSDKTGKICRLPTEAEWEYAARGGKESKGFKFSGGQSIDLTGWYKENSGDKTNPVAQKRANELKLYDMSGNVWEWCEDWYGDYSAGAQTNPRGIKSGSFRVLRGGSWFLASTYCRVASRSLLTPGFRYSYYGFRMVLIE
jgi:sulfatase modifying factor 1